MQFFLNYIVLIFSYLCGHRVRTLNIQQKLERSSSTIRKNCWKMEIDGKLRFLPTFRQIICTGKSWRLRPFVLCGKHIRIFTSDLSWCSASDAQHSVWNWRFSRRFSSALFWFKLLKCWVSSALIVWLVLPVIALTVCWLLLRKRLQLNSIWFGCSYWLMTNL